MSGTFTPAPPTAEQLERAKYADLCFDFHAEANRIISSAALAIMDGAEPHAEVREMVERMSDAAERVLKL